MGLFINEIWLEAVTLGWMGRRKGTTHFLGVKLNCFQPFRTAVQDVDSGHAISTWGCAHLSPSAPLLPTDKEVIPYLRLFL